jgi:hypothetical protein
MHTSSWSQEGKKKILHVDNELDMTTNIEETDRKT